LGPQPQRPPREHAALSPRSPAPSPAQYPLRAGFPGLLPAVDRGQSLVACPLLDVALERFRRCRWFASWMPNDPYDLAYAPAPTASRGSPVGGGRGVAVRAAAVTDHVRDNWYGPAPSTASMPGMGGAHSRSEERLHGICRIRHRNDAQPTPPAEYRAGGGKVANEWARPGLLEPSISLERTKLWSYADLMGLRLV
jgi:hypothetical protein